ncbi:hypothetical protein C0J52_26603 [Blattella germanica]|nr:hypothetical protein C0J52_26603 [Blattella germanica]
MTAMAVFSLSCACPEKCTCTPHNVICKDSTIKSLPRWRPSTLRLFMEGDVLFQLNSSVVNASELTNLEALTLLYMNLQGIHSRAFGGMRHLEMITIRNNNLTDLQPGAFIGLDRLRTLDLSDNELKNISSGVFEGLTALRHLNLTINRLRHFHNGMFDGLRREGRCGEVPNARSVLLLDRNYNGTFDEDSLRGLNYFTNLAMSFEFIPSVSHPTTFEGLCGLKTLLIRLVSLRELLINNESPESQVILTNMGPIYLTSKNKLRYTHPETFAGLSQLKRLELSYFPNDEYSQVNISSLQRLDGFMGPGYFESESLEAMTTLFLIGWYSLVPNEMRTWLSHLTHIKNPIRLEIYYLNSLDDLRTLSEFNIHTLNLILNNISIFRNNDFREFSTLKSLGIGNTLDLVVQNGSFRNLHNLEYLNLYSSKKLFLEPGVFNELHSLQELVIKKNPLSEFDLVPHLITKCLSVCLYTIDCIILLQKPFKKLEFWF